VSTALEKLEQVALQLDT